MDRRRTQTRYILCNEMVRAIEESDIERVQKILDDGLDVDSQLIFHRSPIMHSIGCNRLEIGKIFISNGCSLSLKDTSGKTPLHLAVQFLNFDFVRLLLNNRADLTNIDNDGKTVLHIAAELNSLRMVHLLMERASSELLNLRDKSGKTPFIYACEHGNDGLVSYLIDKGCDVNSQYGPYQFTPLFSAISNPFCSAEIVHKILDAGAYIDHVSNSNETPLLRAFYQLSENSISVLALSSYRNKCSLLIDRGSEVNVRNSAGNSPLHFAVMNCDEYLVRKILNAGSLVDLTNILGLTPLFYACKRGFQNIADILINCGANTKITDLLYGDGKLLFNRIRTHYTPKTITILENIKLKSRQCLSLKNVCRLAIRRNLPQNIQKSAVLLPLPPSLIKFILLIE